MRTLIFLLLPLLIQAQNEPSYNAALIAPHLLENADAVVRLQEIIFNVSAPDEAIWKEKRVVTLLNDKSSYNELVLFYSSFNKIGKIRGSLYDTAGNFLRDVEKNEITDQSAIGYSSIYEDDRVRYLKVSHTRYPYTIVFDYEIKFRDLLYYDNWGIQGFNTSVEKATFSISLPEDIQLYHKSLNINLQPAITADKGKRQYQWKVENLSAVKQEPYAPSVYDVLPQVLLSPSVFKVDGYTGSMTSWKTFGQFQFDLAKGRDELSPNLKTKVHELTAGLTSDIEKIAVLYRYLQENTRYVSVQLGIGGWQPFDAKYVEKNKYGDCKALSNFMKALLKEAGIHSCAVLTTRGYTFPDRQEDFAVPNFNHAILYVPDQNTWLECTSNNLPPNYLGSDNTGRKALLISEQSSKLIDIPALAPSDNTAFSSTVIALTDAGKATVTVKSTLNGALHEWYRYASESLTEEDWKKELQKKSLLSQAYFTQISIQPQKDRPIARVEYALDVPQFGSKAGKRLFIPVNPINAFREIPPANDKRIHPVEMRKGYIEQDTFTFHLPESFSVESIPAENMNLDTEFGSYSGKVIRQERAIQFVRRLEIKPVRLPAGRYGEWRAFLRDVAKADGMKVVLVQKT